MDSAFNDLMLIPGVGKSIAQDLIDMGYTSKNHLIGKDPQELYDELCVFKNCEVDRCMLYVFRCAVYYVSNTEHRPELLKWWNHKD